MSSSEIMEFCNSGSLAGWMATYGTITIELLVCRNARAVICFSWVPLVLSTWPASDAGSVASNGLLTCCYGSEIV